MHGTTHRLRISTTVAPETHEYLASLVENGRATSIAHALDQAVLRARSVDSVERLAQVTTAYFKALRGPAAAEESQLESAIAQMSDKVSFDN